MKAAAETLAAQRPRSWARAISVRPAVVVAVTACGWVAAFLTIAIRQYNAFIDHRFDLGNMTQAVWNTAHGHFLEVTELGGTQITRLGAHVDPLLALFAPLWLLWPSPLMLLTVQIVLLAVGAVPVFWLARKHIGSERAAMQLSLVYLLYPALEWRALNEFYPATVAIPLVLFAIWYLDEDKLGCFAIFAVLAAASQEQMGLLVGGLGLWYALRTRRVAVGFTIATVGLLWTVIAMRVVIPHFSGGPSPFYSRYASVGGSPGGILHKLVTDPVAVLSAAFTTSDLWFLYVSFMPLLGLFVLAPSMSMIALPQLLLSLLSDRRADLSIDGNIFSPVIPFVIAATVFGIARLVRKERFARLVLVATVLCAITSPLATLKTLAPNPDAHDQAAAAAVSLIPASASVSATNDLASHLSARRRIYMFPLTTKATWVAVDLDDPAVPTVSPGTKRVGLEVPRDDLLVRPVQFRREVSRQRRDPHWTLVFHREGILVWRRST